MPTPELRRSLTLTDVALLNVLVIFNLRGLAPAAKLGPLAVVLWLVAVALFLVPLAFAVTELATRDPAEGGLYRWSRTAFGDGHGFLSGWFYWVSNVTYLPAQLLFLAGNVVFVFGRPAWGEAPAFVLPLALGVLWIAAWLSIRGWTVSKLVTNLGATAGWTAALLLVAAGVVVYRRAGSAAQWNWAATGNGLFDVRMLGYFGTLSFALAGLELAPVMAGEIRYPRRTLPRAILVASVVVAALYIAGTAAIIVAVPAAEISPISGAIGPLVAVASHAGWNWLPALGAVLVSFAVTGGVLAWLGATARLPLVAGMDRFLPAAFARLHPAHGTPHVAIIWQAVLATVLIVASQAGATVREAFLMLLEMTIILYFIPFVYLFAALPRLRGRGGGGGVEAGVVRVPGGTWGLWLVALAGLATTLVTMVTAAIPPPDVANPWLFEAKLWGGLAVFAALGLGVYGRFRGAGG